MDGFEAVQEISKQVGGTITKAGVLPDGIGFAVMSMPLPKTHWIYKKDETSAGPFNVPPIPLKIGASEKVMVIVGPVDDGTNDAGLRADKGITMTREGFAQMLREAGRYAVRCATMNGLEMDFDHDALVQNLIVGMIGYHTDDGLSDEEWANPK